MKDTVMLLKRTVFLPKGSPGILALNDIRVDIRNPVVSCMEGRVYCSGEADLLLDYLSLEDSGEAVKGIWDIGAEPPATKPWQALLTLPFELSEEGNLSCAPMWQMKITDIKWYIVAPRALEIEANLLLFLPEAESMAEEALAAQEMAGEMPAEQAATIPLSAFAPPLAPGGLRMEAPPQQLPKLEEQRSCELSGLQRSAEPPERFFRNQAQSGPIQETIAKAPENTVEEKTMEKIEKIEMTKMAEQSESPSPTTEQVQELPQSQEITEMPEAGQTSPLPKMEAAEEIPEAEKAAEPLAETPETTKIRVHISAPAPEPSAPAPIVCEEAPPAEIVNISVVRQRRRAMPAPKPMPAQTQTKGGCRMRFCRVLDGDDLFTLAERAGVSPSLLAEKNDINGAVLTPGAYLRMP